MSLRHFLLSVRRIYARREWSAIEPIITAKALYHPINNITIGSVSDPGNICVDVEGCSKFLRELQDHSFIEVSNGSRLLYSDIPGNFLISTNGLMFEMRGWNRRSEYYSDYYNAELHSLLIGVVVKEDDEEEKRIFEIAQPLIDEGIHLKFISKNPFINTEPRDQPPRSLFIARNAWTDSPQPVHDELQLPITKIIVTQTYDEDESCFTYEACIARVKAINSASDGDISFNFLVGSDGKVYAGRGYRYVGDSIEKSSFNSLGISVAFIGKFEVNQMNFQQFYTLSAFLSQSIRQDWIAEDYLILLQDQLENKERSTTDALLDAMKGHYNKFHPRKIANLKLID